MSSPVRPRMAGGWERVENSSRPFFIFIRSRLVVAKECLKKTLAQVCEKTERNAQMLMPSRPSITNLCHQLLTLSRLRRTGRPFRVLCLRSLQALQGVSSYGFASGLAVPHKVSGEYSVSSTYSQETKRLTLSVVAPCTCAMNSPSIDTSTLLPFRRTTMLSDNDRAWKLKVKGDVMRALRACRLS